MKVLDMYNDIKKKTKTNDFCYFLQKVNKNASYNIFDDWFLFLRSVYCKHNDKKMMNYSSCKLK